MAVHKNHAAKKIGEMIIVAIIVLLLAAMAIFITQRYEPLTSTKNSQSNSNNQDYGAGLATHLFQQVNAPPGQAVQGFPSTLLPANAKITSSYHSEYNGYDQYTVNASTTEAIDSAYTSIQKMLTKAKFSVTQKTLIAVGDTINANLGNTYVTIQLTPIDSSNTTININYGKPIK